MIPKITQQWGSWSPVGINKLSSSAFGAELTYFFLTEDRCYDEIRNFNLKKLNHFSIRHGYFDYDVKIEDATVGVRIAAVRDLLAIEFTPLEDAHDIIVGARIEGAFGARLRVRKEGDVIAAVTGNEQMLNLSFPDGDAAADNRCVLLPLRHKTALVLSTARTSNRNMSARQVTEFMARVRRQYLDKSGGADQKTAEHKRLATASVNLNTIYIPELNEVVCTSSRAWSVGPIWGGYIFFPWDALFMGLLVSLESRELAYANVFAILNQANPNGMLPGGIGKYVVTRDRSNPPVEAWAVLRLYRRFGEKAFLKKCYPALKKSLQFYINHCDGNGDGLYEWYSFPYRMTAQERARHDKVSRLLLFGLGTGTLQGAKYSSGLDNSPTFDDAEFDEKSHTMKMADVGLNSLLVLAAECLETIAEILGRRRDREFFRKFRIELAARIRKNLWDDDAGIYKSRTWNGKRVDILGPMNFYPLLAGIPSGKQAKRMVREHLLNRQEFWGRYVLPTVARNHPSFHDQDYWRGRIWGPTNYLVYAGLRRCGFDKEADLLSAKSARLFMREFRKDSHIHENYNAITGDGDDVNTMKGKIKSDAFYPWGTVLLLPSVEDGGW